MYSKQLSDAGLTLDQSLIYETILKNAPIQAARIAILTKIERTLIYKNITILQEMGLIETLAESKVAKFIPKNPARLQEIVSEQTEKATIANSSIEAIMGSMMSDFNLISGKPNVRFFEGEKGIWQVLDDTLQVAKDELVYQFADISTFGNDLHRINSEYKKKRATRDITKRVIVPATKENLALIQDATTDKVTFKTLPVGTVKLFDTIIYVYKTKVSYITYRKGIMVGAIIDSASINQATTALFEFIWNTLPSTAL